METAYVAGALVGGTLGIFVIYVILETVIFKRVFDDPVKGKLTAVGAAWLVAGLLYGYNTANELGFNPAGFWRYLPATAIVAIYAWRRGLKVRERTVEVGQAFE